MSNILSSFEGLPPELDKFGKEALLSLIDGLDYYVPDLQDTANLTANDIVNILKEEWGLNHERGGGGRSFENIGGEAMTDLKSGIESGEDSAEEAAKGVAKAALDGAKANSGDFYTAGSDASLGFGNGLRSNDSIISRLSAGLAKISLMAMEQELDVNSPSKEFAKLGKFSAEGYAKGFENEFERSKNILSNAIAVNASPKALASAVTAKPTNGTRTAAGVTVVQNIYAKDTSYYGQQREAARQLELVARGLDF